MKSGIYKIKNLVNNKVYVGSSVNIGKRISQHIAELVKGNHYNVHLQFAWNKYGAENFQFEIIEYYKKNKRLEREQYYIDLYDSVRNGYNICPVAGSGGKPCSEETKKLKSVIGMGHVVTEDLRKKISDAKKGKPQTEDHKRRISASKMGHIVTAETLRKKSEAVRREHIIQDGTELKYCSTCESWLPLFSFSERERSWDGRSNKCRICTNEYDTERRREKGVPFKCVKKTIAKRKNKSLFSCAEPKYPDV